MAVGENSLPKKEEIHEDQRYHLNFIDRFTKKTEDKEERKNFKKFFLVKIPEKRLRKTVQSLRIFYVSWISGEER